MRRLINNIKNHKNWLSYYIYKVGGLTGAFTFKLRSGMDIKVPKRLMQTYKECFFDETYFRGLPTYITPSRFNTVIDVGANVGYFSLAALSRNPLAKVYSYEPMPNNFKLLSSYGEESDYNNWTIINRAISGEAGQLELNYNAEDSFTTSASIEQSDREPDVAQVESNTLKQVLEEHHLDKVDFLKLDCEGSEYPILYQSNKETLEKILCLSVETHRSDQSGYNRDDLAAFLKRLDYSIHLEKDQIWAWRK